MNAEELQQTVNRLQITSITDESRMQFYTLLALVNIAVSLERIADNIEAIQTTPAEYKPKSY